MDLSRYAQDAQWQAQEMIAELSEEEVTTLRAQLQGVPWSKWNARRGIFGKTVATFVSATPSQRRRKKEWNKDFPMLVLAAIQHCQEAAFFLRAVDSLQLRPGFPGHKYRHMTAQAGLAFQKVNDEVADPWPFDGGDPFVYPSPEPPENTEDSA